MTTAARRSTALLGALAILLVLLGPPARAAGSPDAEHGAVARLLWLVNESRHEAGVPPLEQRADVVEVARPHSAAMAQDGHLRHNDAYFSEENRRRLHARLLGEAVAVNADPDEAHRRLMRSDGHREALLDPRFTVVGVAAVHGSGGAWWITIDLVQPR